MEATKPKAEYTRWKRWRSPKCRVWSYLLVVITVFAKIDRDYTSTGRYQVCKKSLLPFLSKTAQEKAGPWIIALGLGQSMLQKSLRSNTILMNSLVTALHASRNWRATSELLITMCQLGIPYNHVSFAAAFSEIWATSLGFLRRMSSLQLQLDLIARSSLLKIMPTRQWQQSLTINDRTHSNGIALNAQYIAIYTTACRGEWNSDTVRWPQALELHTASLISHKALTTRLRIIPDAGNYNTLFAEWHFSSLLLHKMAAAGIKHAHIYSTCLQRLQDGSEDASKQWQFAFGVLGLMNNARVERDVSSFLLVAGLSIGSWQSWHASISLLPQMLCG